MAQKKTPKQAAARVSVLLRGIDNSVSIIEKQRGRIDSSLREAKTLLSGLSNAVVEAKEAATKAQREAKEAKEVAKKAAKVAKKPAPPKKVAKKPAAKKPAAKKPAAKKAKKPAAKKAAKKPAAKKPAPAKKPAAAKTTPINGESKKTKPLKERFPPKENRPLLKDAIRELLKASGAPMSMPDIYNQIVEKWGYWSRQSFYNVIRDKKNFKSDDDEMFTPVEGEVQVTDKEADEFVASVASSTEIGQAVSNVQ